jgi:hypothetical protein
VRSPGRSGPHGSNRRPAKSPHGTWSRRKHVRIPGRAPGRVFPDAGYADLPLKKLPCRLPGLSHDDAPDVWRDALVLQHA